MRIAANTAIFLSLAFLTACAGPQVAKTPTETQGLAEEAMAKGRYEEAAKLWKQVKETAPSPQLVTEAELKTADALFSGGNYIESASAYEEFRKLHPSHPKNSYALFRAGLSYFKQIERIDTDQTSVKNAASVFEKVLTQFPQSEYAAESREKLQQCRTKMALYENYVGRFYLRTDRYDAAIGRLEGALEKFPGSGAEDETLFLLVLAYHKKGDQTKAEERLGRLTRDYPSSLNTANAKKILGKP